MDNPQPIKNVEPKFGPQHWYAIAKEIRQVVPYAEFTDSISTAQRGVLIVLALNLAIRFNFDNPNFDPLDWLDRCSPDPDQMPFNQLWAEREEH